MRKNLVIPIVLILSLLIALPVAAGGISGPGVSGIQIQNLDNEDANVTVQLWNQNGSAAIPISGTGGDTIAKSSAKNYYLPNFSNVPDGAYAMVVSSNKPVAALARTDWSNSGGAAIYISVSPGKDITVPLVLSNYSGQTSQFSIQNTNTSSSINDVKITLYGRGLIDPVKTLTGQTIPAGTSKTYSMADPIWGTLPNTGLDQGSEGFVGTVRIESATDLVVQSFIDVTNSARSVSGFSGVPTNSADTTVFCPLIRANYYGDTGISIVNPNANEVTVTITFYADALSPHSGTFTQEVTVSGNSSNLAWQGPGGNSREDPTNLPGGTQNTSNPNYTNDGFYGVAKLASTGGPILAVVNDNTFASNWSTNTQTTYNCLTQANAGSTFAMPLIRKKHLNSTRLTTGVNIQNTTGSAVEVAMEIYNYDGARLASADPAPKTIPAYGSGNFYQGDLVNVPTVPSDLGGYGWFGSAIVKVNTPGGTIVLMASDEGTGTTKVDSANYEGLLLP